MLIYLPRWCCFSVPPRQALVPVKGGSVRIRRAMSLAATGALLLGGLSLATPSANAQPFGYDKLTPIQKRHTSGALTEALGPQAAAASAVAGSQRASAPDCDGNRGSNVKVSQNCLTITDQPLAGRAQAQNETWVAVNPSNPQQVVATYNDYRRGDGTCGVSYSGNGGH